MTKHRKLVSTAVCTSMLAVVLLAGACGKSGQEHAFEPAAAEQELMVTPQVEESAPIERKLIREGSLSFETDDLMGAQRDLDSLIKRYKGYVTADQSFHTYGRESRSLTVRVPADNFDALVTAIGRVAQRIDQRDIRTQDVTEEFVDVEARLRTKKELESRYLKLLDRAANVEEILAIEQQIGALRADIEATEGRLRYLSNQSDLSTLNISYYRPIPTTREFGRRFKDGFGNGWENFVDFIIWIINGWPFFVVLAAALFAWKRWWTKRRQRKGVSESNGH